MWHRLSRYGARSEFFKITVAIKVGEKSLILSIDDCVPRSGTLLYLHLISNKIFFILQSLTTSKMRKFQTLKLSRFHKAKTCWTEKWWSSGNGIMSKFFWKVFLCFGGQKNCDFFFKYWSVPTKKLHKMKLEKCFFDTWKKKYLI